MPGLNLYDETFTLKTWSGSNNTRWQFVLKIVIFQYILFAYAKIEDSGHRVFWCLPMYSNQDLVQFMDTSDEWIQERTGIKERRYADRLGETTTMGVKAATIAMQTGRALLHRISISSFLPPLAPIIISRLRRIAARAMKMGESAQSRYP